jgi:hypothetical protein
METKIFTPPLLFNQLKDIQLNEREKRKKDKGIPNGNLYPLYVIFSFSFAFVI